MSNFILFPDIAIDRRFLSEQVGVSHYILPFRLAFIDCLVWAHNLPLEESPMASFSSTPLIETVIYTNNFYLFFPKHPITRYPPCVSLEESIACELGRGS